MNRRKFLASALSSGGALLAGGAGFTGGLPVPPAPAQIAPTALKLTTYHADIRAILIANMVRDIQIAEDDAFIKQVEALV